MQSVTTTYLAVLSITAIIVSGSVIDRAEPNPFQTIKRGLSDPNDPRNLYSAVYRNYRPYKRGFDEGVRGDVDLDELYSFLMDRAINKRGLRDPNDPRNLFRAIYGYKK